MGKPLHRLKNRDGTARSADQQEKNAANGEWRGGANADKFRNILFGSNRRE